MIFLRSLENNYEVISKRRYSKYSFYYLTRFRIKIWLKRCGRTKWHPVVMLASICLKTSIILAFCRTFIADVTNKTCSRKTGKLSLHRGIYSSICYRIFRKHFIIRQLLTLTLALKPLQSSIYEKYLYRSMLTISGWFRFMPSLQYYLKAIVNYLMLQVV